MKVLIRPRGRGKTTELIKESYGNQTYILTLNRKRADDINRQTERMGLYIPNPVTLEGRIKIVTYGTGSEDPKCQ